MFKKKAWKQKWSVMPHCSQRKIEIQPFYSLLTNIRTFSSSTSWIKYLSRPHLAPKPWRSNTCGSCDGVGVIRFVFHRNCVKNDMRKTEEKKHVAEQVGPAQSKVC